MTEIKPGMRAVQYVGGKASKRDNVTYSGIVWDAPGAVRTIPEALASKLCVHKDVWVDVTDAITDGESITENLPPPQGAQFPGDRGDQIAAAVNTMRIGDEEHFNKGGKPRIEIIESILNYEVSAQERDVAWDRVVQSRMSESHGDPGDTIGANA